MTVRGGVYGRLARLRSVQPGVPLGLMGLWMLLSGKMSVFHLGVGAMLAAVLVWQSLGVEPLEKAGRPRIRYLRAVPYGAWLFWQMILSALQVARVILRPSRHLDPQMIEFRCVQPSLLNSVLLSGSITLTPGTVTIDLGGDHHDRYVVHALTARSARDVLEGDMARRVAALSTDEPMPPIEVITGPRGGGGAS